MSVNYNSDMKDIDETKVFVNDLIKWNKGSLPEFFKILVMNVTFFSKKQKYEQRSQLILMLILRALLHIKREFNIDEEIEKMFLNKLSSFRKTIKNMLDNKEIENLNKLKLTYCMDIERVLLEQGDNQTLDLNILFKYTVPFFSDIDKVNIEDDLLNKMIKYFKKYKVALLE